MKRAIITAISIAWLAGFLALGGLEHDAHAPGGSLTPAQTVTQLERTDAECYLQDGRVECRSIDRPDGPPGPVVSSTPVETGPALCAALRQAVIAMTISGDVLETCP